MWDELTGWNPLEWMDTELDVFRCWDLVPTPLAYLLLA